MAQNISFRTLSSVRREIKHFSPRYRLLIVRTPVYVQSEHAQSIVASDTVNIMTSGYSKSTLLFEPSTLQQKYGVFRGQKRMRLNTNKYECGQSQGSSPRARIFRPGCSASPRALQRQTDVHPPPPGVTPMRKGQRCSLPRLGV